MVDLRLRRRAAVMAVALALARPSPAFAGPAAGAPEDSNLVRLHLTVRRAGDRVPLSETRVLVAQTGEPPAWIEDRQTDEAGTVALEVPAGRVRVIVLAPGFERFDAEVETVASPVILALDPLPTNPYRTVVSIPREVQPGVSSRRLGREEIATVPGAQGDALRALQSLPGVARTPGGLGLLVLRGASPNQSVMVVGEHRVPRAFHALALSSVVPADALDEVELVPGNFSSRYGNGTGGAVVLHPRAGRRDGVHGYAELDLGAAGAMLEGPLGRGSFLAGAQRGYVDAFLRTVELVDPTQTFVLPTSWDYQLFVDQPVGARTSVTARVLGAEDRILSRYYDGVEKRDGVELQAGFHRADLELRHRHGPWSLLLSPSLRYEHQSLGVEEDRAVRRDYVTSGRAELSAQLGRRARLTVGADTEVDPFHASYTVFGDLGPMREQSTALQTSTGVYTMTDLRLGPLTLVPGARVNAFTLDRSARVSVDPRLLARLEPSAAWTWSAGVGLYSQPVLDLAGQTAFGFVGDTLGFGALSRWRLPSAIFSLIPDISLATRRPDVRLAQALQASTAVGYSPSSSWTLEAGAYVRVRDESLATTTTPEGDPLTVVSPITHNYGMELLLRRHLVGDLYGWISYTLSWARLLADRPTGGRQRITDPFDQRHNLAIVGSYALPRHWRIGGRFRLVSGSPYTPVVGAVDDPTSTFGPTADDIWGEPNSARFPVFHQLDLRVDKRWYLRRVIFDAYLDVQNIYNRQNVETYFYSADYRRKDGSLGLPIFPSLGLRVDF